MPYDKHITATRFQYWEFGRLQTYHRYAVIFSNKSKYLLQVTNRFNGFQFKMGQSLTVRPELVEGGMVKPFMVRQAHHERLNHKVSRIKWEADLTINLPNERA